MCIVQQWSVFAKLLQCIKVSLVQISDQCQVSEAHREIALSFSTEGKYISTKAPVVNHTPGKATDQSTRVQAQV